MAFPSGPRSNPFTGAMAARPKAGPIVAVGSRATVTRPTGSAAVTLTDANGIGSLATLAEGAEVEILAWQPQRAGGTRYRVRTTEGGPATEGWLSAFQLTPRPIVVSPPRPAPERIAPKRAGTTRTTAAARTATAAAARKR